MSSPTHFFCPLLAFKCGFWTHKANRSWGLQIESNQIQVLLLLAASLFLPVEPSGTAVVHVNVNGKSRIRLVVRWSVANRLCLLRWVIYVLYVCLKLAKQFKCSCPSIKWNSLDGFGASTAFAAQGLPVSVLMNATHNIHILVFIYM